MGITLEPIDAGSLFNTKPIINWRGSLGAITRNKLSFLPSHVTYLKSTFYNNCLISCALIGSFLSSIRVQTDKILIYASSQVQLSAVKLSTF